MRTRVIVCPNPECHKEIKEPILFTVREQNYSACPHCFIELNEHSTALEETAGAPAKEDRQDAVFGRAAASCRRDPLAALAPNHRFRRP